MDFDQVRELCCDPAKNRGKGLSLLDTLTELRSNEIDEIGFTRDKTVIGVNATSGSPRIVSQAGSQTTCRCPAKRPELDHGAFTGIGIASQMIEQLAFFQAEHAQGIASGLSIGS